MTTSQHFARQRIVNEHKMRAKAMQRYERTQQCQLCIFIGDWIKRIGNYLLEY